MPLYGPVWPLKTGNRDTYELYEDLKQQISFYLKNLLLTSPTENISDPNYGVGLRRYLFEQNTEGVRSNLQSVIRNQVSSYLPYLIVEEVEVLSDASDIDANSLKIRIIYQIPTDATNQIFELDLGATQEIGFY